MKTNSSQKYYLWIDILKGIGILFVTFAHLYPNIALEKHIYSFHMFLFFFISGFLFKNPNNEKTYYTKQFKILLIPFLFWNIISTIIEIILNGNYTDCIERLFLINGKICWNAPIWFLLILFIIKTMYVFLKKHTKIHDLQILFFSLLAFFLSNNNNLTMKIGIVPIGIIFYIIGIKFKERQTTKNNFESKKNILLILLTLCIINFTFTYSNIRISVINSVYGNCVYCLIAGISGILIYLIISKIISKKKNIIVQILTKLGHDSMIIMCAQYYVFRIINYIFKNDIWHQRGTLKALIITILTISIIELGVLICKKLKLKKISFLIGIR